MKQNIKGHRNGPLKILPAILINTWLNSGIAGMHNKIKLCLLN